MYVRPHDVLREWQEQCGRERDDGRSPIATLRLVGDVIRHYALYRLRRLLDGNGVR